MGKQKIITIIYSVLLALLFIMLFVSQYISVKMGFAFPNSLFGWSMITVMAALLNAIIGLIRIRIKSESESVLSINKILKVCQIILIIAFIAALLSTIGQVIL